MLLHIEKLLKNQKIFDCSLGEISFTFPDRFQNILKRNNLIPVNFNVCRILFQKIEKNLKLFLWKSNKDIQLIINILFIDGSLLPLNVHQNSFISLFLAENNMFN